MKRIAVLALLALLIGAFFALDLDRYLTLGAIKEAQAGFESLQQRSPSAFAAGYLLIYITVTALSLPGAAVMTLAGGALFGLVGGTVLVSFASSIGATLAFLAARYVFREGVQRRFGHRLGAVNNGIARDGAFYLFTLRLVPVFPFFLINLLMGLTAMRAFTFYWVSQVGMLAGTVVYVNAGTQLARIESLSGILSPALITSFAVLGFFPLAARRIAKLLQARRVYRRWTRPKRFDRNLVVVGAGAAGLVTAYVAAAVKAKVTLVESNKMGGDCLNTGCVPSKALIRAAKLVHDVSHAEDYGLDCDPPRVDFRTVMARVRAVIRAIEPHDSIERYTRLGVEVIQGYARLLDPWTVEISLAKGGTQRLSARNIVIAAGARPAVPQLPGIEASGYVTSDTLWDALESSVAPPPRLAVLGGGPIGCELAQCLARLGSQVTLIEQASELLGREDPEVSAFARTALESDGVTVLTGRETLRCETKAANKMLVISRDGVEQAIEFDLLLCAVGRAARLEGYGLEALGIPTGRTLLTNEYLETIYPNIFAAGDVTGPFQFTHVGAHQAWHAAVNALFGNLKKFKVDYSNVPWTTFIDPEVARLGLNEQEARSQGIPYEVTRYDLAELDRAITDGATQGFVKVLTAPGRDRILGVTIVAENAADMLAEYVLAKKYGLGLNKILGTIHIYPTFAEANKYAAGEWKRTHAPRRLLAWVERFHTWRRGWTA